jgi:ergothioneine biosynthesis protein EgtB
MSYRTQQSPRRLELDDVLATFRRTRQRTVDLVDTLSPEDMVVQAAVFASPAKWHLGHTTWFFETFLLCRFSPAYDRYDERFNCLFNSYYNAIGSKQPRHQRGLMTRPGSGEVLAYRDTIDELVARCVKCLDGDDRAEALTILDVGIEHEMQHQELLLTDILYTLFASPVMPAFREADTNSDGEPPARGLAWVGFDETIARIGVDARDAETFTHDNESPNHRVFLERFELATRCVTNAEFAGFVEDDAYTRHELWLDDAWSNLNANDWRHPLYWRRGDDGWETYTHAGWHTLDPEAPVSGLSFYEAEAYARWAGARLPTEAEWEHACRTVGAEPINTLEDDRLRPVRETGRTDTDTTLAMRGNVWEWTRSSYDPYPGFAPAGGNLSEYNGKFMSGQYVLRGGSCLTPLPQTRASYRNFFHPDLRWQCAGVRLARSP